MNSTVTTTPVTITTIPDSTLGQMLQAAIKRAEAAEAVIASIPLTEIKYLVDHSKYGAVNRRCRDAVREWLQTHR